MAKFIKSFLLSASMLVAFSANATDQLNNTKWVNFNEDGKPNAVLRFVERGGKLSAKVEKVLINPENKTKCDECKGKYHNKPLVGATLIWDLEPDASNPNVYDNGTGIDPKTGITFSGKAKLEGDTLKLRGYKGVSFLGKTHVLKRL
nr:DUF2147 domain-containing protein [uncultured Psychrobacter sp.]